jgi:hypothetical protein
MNQMLTKKQENAIFHIQNSFAAGQHPVCALDTGSGKTRVACKVMSDFISDCNTQDYYILLVITTSNKKRAEEAMGNDRIYSFPASAVIVTSYKKLLIDLKNKRFNESRRFDLIIYDELHTIINSRKPTKTSLLLTQLSCMRKLALTATPAKNVSPDHGLMYIFLNEDRITTDPDQLKKGIEDCIKSRVVFLGGHQEIAPNNISKFIRVISLPAKKEALAMMREMGTHQKIPFLSHFNSISNDVPEETLPLCTKVTAVRIILSKIPKKDKTIL